MDISNIAASSLQGATQAKTGDGLAIASLNKAERIHAQTAASLITAAHKAGEPAREAAEDNKKSATNPEGLGGKIDTHA